LADLPFVIKRAIARADPRLVAAFAKLSSAAVADGFGRDAGKFRLDPALRPVYSPMVRIVGSAVTVEVEPQTHLMVAKAVHMVEPGDVIVVDGGGDIHWSICGGNLCRIAKLNGCRGIIIDGATRDADEAREMGFPVIARSLSPTPSPLSGRGAVNLPIVCGGITVRPGDIVVADNDGTVIVPVELAETVLKEAAGKASTDEWRSANIKAWNDEHAKIVSDEHLAAMGCVID
jgi:4-hydroxy-4-methyl-2-oxoglutarate aldolase